MDRVTTLRMLRDIAAGFDGHDVDRIMANFADGAAFERPRGSDPWGTRFTGSGAVRTAFEELRPRTAFGIDGIGR